MPEIYEITNGLIDKIKCPACKASRRYPSGDLQVRLGDDRAKMWPDVIACGDYPCFVVSDRFVNAMKDCGVRLILGGRVDFIEPIENGLTLDNAPQYFWIDGKQHLAGKMDFEASGFVDVRFCSECGNRTDDITLTHRRQNTDPPTPYVFDYDEAARLDLFTTDIAPTAFFCTERIFQCARGNKLTNIRFIPVEHGDSGKPIKY